MRHLIVLACLATFPLAAPAETTLNKCIDARGAVTYSNLPCRMTQEARKVAVDPAPSAAAQASPASNQPRAPAEKPAQLNLDVRRVPPRANASSRPCDALADKLGSVLDKMDQARRHGYTQAQMAKWNEEIQVLERKKQQAGCF